MPPTAATTDARRELDKALDGKWLSGLWNVSNEERTGEPKTKVTPHLWKWADVYDSLQRARDIIDIGGGTTERRYIRLVNPGLGDRKLTAHTMLFGFQLIQPGEVAPAHRHTMTAFRFVIQGKGAFTNVDGEKMLMQPGDLIRTPQWAWHEHENQGSEAMIWADGLDVPLIETLQVVSVERRHEERLRVKEGQIHPSLYGMMRPAGRTAQPLVAPLHYRWSDSYAALLRLAESVADPYDGVALDYVDPLTGGPTFPTLLCRLQMFRPGEQTQSHRHRSTSIYHVFRGSGTTEIDGKALAWEQGDSFVVPLWSWHSHANGSSQDEAILFSLHDEPVLRAFGLYLEEGAAS
ncbi:MAG: cupin domain-containing protein [Candidatus Binatia bacterium]